MFALTATLLALAAPANSLDRIDGVVEAAIGKGRCPGAVVLVVRDDAVVYRKAFGLRAKVPQPVPMTLDTVFDMASLTKPVATATSIAVLVDRGKLRYTDPVAKHWPAFAANGKDAVTVEHCLLHVAGLTADNPIADYTGSHADMLGRVAGQKLEAPVGTRFKYSDVGYIVLGEVVARVGVRPLNEFAAEAVFAPLKMADTTFRPGAALTPRVAPTGKRDGAVILGDVHDPRAFALGGVAGHAGLFGTADDLARFARTLLRGGELDGVRVLSPLAARRVVAPRPVPGGLRSRGWDVDTAYSAPRGDLFPAGDGYGHTGFTGTSLWVDPPSRTAIVVLTNRVHPDDGGNTTELRRQVGTIVAEWVYSVK